MIYSSVVQAIGAVGEYLKLTGKGNVTTTYHCLTNHDHVFEIRVSFYKHGSTLGRDKNGDSCIVESAATETVIYYASEMPILYDGQEVEIEIEDSSELNEPPAKGTWYVSKAEGYRVFSDDYVCENLSHFINGKDIISVHQDKGVALVKEYGEEVVHDYQLRSHIPTMISTYHLPYRAMLSDEEVETLLNEKKPVLYQHIKKADAVLVNEKLMHIDRINTQEGVVGRVYDFISERTSNIILSIDMLKQARKELGNWVLCQGDEKINISLVNHP